MFRIFDRIKKRQENRLPLLKFVSDIYPDINLSNTLVIACQHLLGTTYDLFDEMFKKGLKPENVYLIGKCYSTNKETFHKFVNRGVNVSAYSSEFDSYVSFDEQFQGYIEKFLQEIKTKINTKNYEKVVILDDGGNLILFANDFFEDSSNFIGIEQTSSGYEKIKDINLSFPVINIARSKTKLQYESPMIAELIADKAKKYIKSNGLSNPTILVIGQGYIGKAITEILKRDFSVNGCDNLAHKCDFRGDYRSRLDEFDIIIGAVGKTVLSAGDFGKLKNGVVLISASSSDREFSAVYLRRLESQTNNCHKDFIANKIKLLNGGFPINFDGNEHSLKPEKIQLTRALLLAGFFESISIKDEKGLQELNDNIQNKIIEEFLK